VPGQVSTQSNSDIPSADIMLSDLQSPRGTHPRRAQKRPRVTAGTVAHLRTARAESVLIPQGPAARWPA